MAPYPIRPNNKRNLMLSDSNRYLPLKTNYEYYEVAMKPKLPLIKVSNTLYLLKSFTIAYCGMPY